MFDWLLRLDLWNFPLNFHSISLEWSVQCPANHTWHYWWIIVLDQFHIPPPFILEVTFVIQKSNLRLEYLGYLIWVLNDLFVFKHQVSEFTLLIVFFGWILTNQHGRKNLSYWTCFNWFYLKCNPTLLNHVIVNFNFTQNLWWWSGMRARARHCNLQLTAKCISQVWNHYQI